MATISLNSTDRTNINRAITLLESNPAPEIVYPSGVHDDIVFLVGKAANRSGFETAGKFKENMANAPISTLLLFIKSLFTSPPASLTLAIDWLVKSQAEELPLDAQINYVISQAHGSFDQQLNFQQRLQDKPISTLLRYLVYIST